MSEPDIEFTAVAADATRALHAFAAQARDVADPSATVPALEWTAEELTTHVLAGARSYEHMMQGDAIGWRDLEDGPAENRRIMHELVAEHGLPQLADAIDAVADELAAAWASASGDETIPWHGGLELRLRDGVALFLSDALVHSRDLARLTRAEWDMRRSEALAIIGAIAVVAPAFVDEQAAQGFRATYGIRLRGGPTYAFRFDDGVLAVDAAAPPKADCRMHADPTAFVLTSYGRVSPTRAALSGKIVAYGRKPWLAFKFGTLVRNP
jgi:hypothetical protein